DTWRGLLLLRGNNPLLRRRNDTSIVVYLLPLQGFTRGSAKNCAIFPIASFLGLTMVALLQSKHDYKGSNVNQINTIDATRDNVAFDYGCFSVFRVETTLQNWHLRTMDRPFKKTHFINRLGTSSEILRYSLPTPQ